MPAARYLYLTRHGQALPDESGLAEDGLAEDGRRQAALLGARLRDVPLSVIHHGPLPRAEQTAQLVAARLTTAHLDGVPLIADEAAGDYVPYEPSRGELPTASADRLLGFVGQFPPEERAAGPTLAAQALARFTGPVDGDEPRHELLVTHNFLAGWLVRDAHDAPHWRWLGLNHGNAALTVIRYAPDRPAAVLVFNDVGHLPAELRWTGLPPELHV